MLDNDEEANPEMTIVEWLRRLNLEKYAKRFSKENHLFVSDLNQFVIDDWRAEDFAYHLNMRNKRDASRICSMINRSNPQIKQDFALITPN